MSPPSNAKDITGLREQILDNILVAFPYYYQGDKPIKRKHFSIILHSEFKPMATQSYTAEAVWGSRNRAFVEGTAGSSPSEALESLLVTSARVLHALRQQGKLKSVSDQGKVMKVAGGGKVAMEVVDDW